MTPYILVIKNFMTPLFFFPKMYDPPVYLGPTPSKENASPLNGILDVWALLKPNQELPIPFTIIYLPAMCCLLTNFERIMFYWPGLLTLTLTRVAF